MSSAGGRHANTAGADETSTVGQYWSNFKYRARRMVTDEAPEDEALMDVPPEEGYMSGLSEMTDLTYTQRIMGFFMVLAMGLIFIFISLSPTMLLMPKKFAFFMTCGNLFCLASITLLVGIQAQITSMFQANRFEAACLYIISTFMTLMCALWLKSMIGCMVFTVVQVACLLWYALSYIPYARQTLYFVTRALRTVLGPVVDTVASGISTCIRMVSS